MTTRTVSSPPRLLLARRAARTDLAGSYTLPVPPPTPQVTPADRDEFLELILGADEAGPPAYVHQLRAREVDVSAIYLELLAPTAERLGDMWSEDSCDFLDVTLAMGRLQRTVRELGHDFVGGSPDGADDRRVLLSAIPGEQHTLGLFMVADYLLRDGWGVRVATPATSTELAAVMREHWFDVVGFSVGCDTRLLALRHEIAAVRRNSRNPQVAIVVGGRIFVEHPELVGHIGADGFAASAADAPCCARALVGAHSG